MVERRLLTTEFTEAAIPPSSGEKWIADTAVRGFGLRLWATKSGGQKVYAIRVSDWMGRSIRKSYDGSWHSRNWVDSKLEGVRNWARREIRTLKQSPADQRALSKIERNKQKRVLKLTFQQAAESAIRVLRAKGQSQRYLDHIDKLFVKSIPERTRKKSVGSVTPKEIAKALVLQKVSGPNSRILRSFISQLFQHVARYHSPSWNFSKKLSDEFWRHWQKHADVRFPELRDLKDSDFQRLFQVLEEEKRWQQALAIRLYFKFTTSMVRIQSAKWKQILDGTWYPVAPGERRFWRSYEQRLDDEARRILAKVHASVVRDFGRHIYLFPSPSKKGRPVATVQTVWRSALEKAELPFYPLREFSRSYREFFCPSYNRWFLEYMEGLLNRPEKVAELSKKLERRLNTSINSNDYS